MSIQVYSTPESKVADAALVQVEETQSAPVADKAAEQNAPTKSDTVETEEEAEEAEEADAGDVSADSKDDDKDKPKKKSGAQRRKERAERAEAEVVRLQKLVEEMAFKNAGDSKKPSEAEVKTAEAKSAPSGEPDPDQFETHRDYVRALAKWEAKQMLDERDQQAERAKLKAQQEQVLTTHQERVKSFAEKTSDWADTIESVEDVILSPSVERLIITSENGPEIMYELAKNRSELERICKLEPLAAAHAMGRFEARLTSKPSEATKPEQKKLTTQAPAPIAPVGSKGGPVRKNLTDPNLSQREYEALRREQLAAKTSSW